MRRLFHRGQLPALAAIVVLSGCSFSSTVSPATSTNGVGTPQSSSNTLLYVANGSATSGVDILTFPQGKRIAKITNIGCPRGVCADAAGHVWITAYLHNRTFALYEFARGATDAAPHRCPKGPVQSMYGGSAR